MDPLILSLLVLAALILAMGLWIRSAVARGRTADDPALAQLQGQVQAAVQQSALVSEQLRTSVQDLGRHLQRSLDANRQTLDERLDGASRTLQAVHRQLGELGESTRHVFEVGKEIAELQQALRSPKLRGNIGELFLLDLLHQILPPGHVRAQYAFRGGDTVDAVILLKAGMVPVDAKFPLENFRRLVPIEDEEQRRAARKAFLRDVKAHVDAIAAKYIRPDEGTFDFALMYIPAENVYYETIIKEEDDLGSLPLFSYALERRVIPVSPNSFYAYLQTILLGLKGMRVEESARDIIGHLARLESEVGRFQEAFRLVGRHLENALKQYNEAERRLGRVEGKMEEIEGTARGVEAAVPPSLPGDGHND